MRKKVAAPVALIAALLAPQLFASQYSRHLLVLVLINVMVVLGMHLLTGVTGQLSFGQGAFMGIGAYTGSLLLVNEGVPYIVGMLVALTSAAVIALLLGPLILRLRGDYFVIATIGLGQVVYLVLLNWVSVTEGPLGVSGVPAPQFGPLALSSDSDFYYFILALNALIAFGLWRMERSRVGRALRAIREDELAASSLGVRVRWFKVVALTISAGLAGLAGLLFGSYAAFISPPSFGYIQSVTFAIMIILGGLGSMAGAVLGAIIVTLAPEALRSVEELRLPLYGAVLALLMIFRPAGLLGKQVDGGLRRYLPFPRKRIEAGRHPAIDPSPPAANHAADSTTTVPTERG